MFRLGENKKKHLNEVEAVNNSSCLDKTQSKNSCSSINDETKYKGKSPKNAIEKEKKSIWSWDKFKALIGNQKFNCCFTLQVHCVEGLPSFFEDSKISVHWKRKDEEFVTRPARVIDGVAEFDDYFRHSCSIYGSKSGPHNSSKYEPKHFLLFISVYGNDELDLGKHRIDLTRILPLTLEELEEENKSGNWATSFRLSGLAKGAVMKVSFGYIVVRNSSSTNERDAIISKQNSETAFKYLRNHGKCNDENRIRRARSHPVRSFSSLSIENVKDLHEILPTSTSESLESKNTSLDNKLENDVDKGIETSSKESISSNKDIAVVKPLETAMDCRTSLQDEVLGGEQSSKTKETSKKLLIKDLKLDLTKTRMDFQEDEYWNEENDPESPRERLLREFEEGDLDHFCSLIDSDMETYEEEFNDCASFSSIWETISGDSYQEPSIRGVDHMNTVEMHPVRSMSSVPELEGLETETPMSEWGVNEDGFQDPPCRSISSPCELSQLGEGIGSSIQTNGGGFLRSMNPSLFMNAKSGGKLVMQVSAPVVVPAEMGSSIMDILQHLASIGIEKLSIQANKLMPLEDISGRTMQQIAYEGSPIDINRNESKSKSSSNRSINIDHISLENLAPFAMEKIEALSLEGLRIQSGRSDDDASTKIFPRSASEFSSLEGINGLKLMDIKNNSDDNNNDNDDGGLMSLFLPLDEWMKLDAGKFDDEHNISERTYKILAAHHAKFSKVSTNEKSHDEGRKCGWLRNNFTIALMVQLRDPLRDYETVGTPMLSLIQIERVFSPLKQRNFNINSQVSNTNDDVVEAEDEDDDEDKDEGDETQYKNFKVHVAGFVSEPTKQKQWGSSSQQRSGSRWLLANGMGKKNKHPLKKSNFVSNSMSCSSISTLKSTNNVQPSDTLWNISSSVGGTGDKHKENDIMNPPHTRNPNIIFPRRTYWLW